MEALKGFLEAVDPRGESHPGAGAIQRRRRHAGLPLIGFKPHAVAQDMAGDPQVQHHLPRRGRDTVGHGGHAAPELQEEETGKVEVRETFKVPKIGIIAGCFVLGARSTRCQRYASSATASRSSGKITSLKRFKDDAKEVVAGFECGIGLEGFHDIKVGTRSKRTKPGSSAKKLEGSRDAGSKAPAN